MKDLNLIVWVTQLGFSVAFPPVAIIWGAVWLRDRFGLGNWVVVAGVVLGLLCAIDGLRSSMKAMLRMTKRKKEEDPPCVSFNDHD